jgi:hypothetical protein
MLALRKSCERIPRDLDDLGPGLGPTDEVEGPFAGQQLGAIENHLDVGVLQSLPRGRDSLDEKDALRIAMLALSKLASPLQE